MSHPLLIVLGCMLTMLLPGCQNKDTIQTQQIPKEEFETFATIKKKQVGFTWTTPGRWEQKPAGKLQKLVFSVPGTNANQGEMTVTVLSGNSGTLLANINRWRGQVSLRPINARKVKRFVKHIDINGDHYHIVDLFPPKRKSNKAKRKRILAAIMTRSNQQTWFFKLSGDVKTVRVAQSEFMDFLNSVHF